MIESVAAIPPMSFLTNGGTASRLPAPKRLEPTTAAVATPVVEINFRREMWFCIEAPP
jgi:hypothetical protein